MRVLYVIDSVVASGGAERSLVALAPQLIARGVELDVRYLVERPGLQDELRKAGATVEVVGSASRLRRIGEIRSAVLATRPDLVHTTLFEADVTGRTAARLARTPVVSSLVNVAYGPEQRRDPRLSAAKLRGAQAIDAATARGVSRFHAITNYVADVMGRRLRIPRSKINVISRGRDAPTLGRRSPERAGQARHELGVPEDVPLIVAAGRHEWQKGLDVLIEAFAMVREQHRDAVLLVAGREGNQTRALLAQIERFGLSSAAVLLGSRSDVPELLAAADVFAFPSRWEGLGSVLLEAMALEAPIVASHIPAVAEIVDERSALLVLEPTPNALATRILQALDEPHEGAARAKLAREVFLERFTIERVADQMLAFYERALAA